MTGLITDPQFDSNRTEEYKLSIQVSLDGFYFSVVHAHQKQLLALAKFPIKLSSSKFLGRHFKEWIQKNEVLQKKYYSTTVIYNPECETFVPSEFYDYSHQEVVAELAFGGQNGDQLYDNYLPNASGNLVFPVSKNLQEVLEQLFPKQKPVHPVTILDNELEKLDNKKGIKMALSFDRDNFTLFLYDNSRLKLVNRYNFASADDVVFYTVTVLKKLKLIPEKTTLYMAGDIYPHGRIHTNLKKIFSRTIFFIPEVQYNAEIFREPLHRFIVLF